MTVVIPLKEQSLLSKETSQKRLNGRPSQSTGERVLQNRERRIFLRRRPAKEKKMKEALFRAHFVEKKNIGDIKALEEIGQKMGLGIDFSKRLRAGG